MKGAFMLGDVVKLKSGGLPMTVVGINGQGVNCQWQDAQGRPQSATWNVVALKEPETSPVHDASATTVAQWPGTAVTRHP